MIGRPTIVAVGSDGSQALSVLALHGRLDQMKKVLAVYELCEKAGPRSTYYEALPSLLDRKRVVTQLSSTKQISCSPAKMS